MEGLFVKLVSAAKGSIDLLAFFGIGLLFITALVLKVTLWDGIAAAVVLAAIWILLRYALLRVQSAERLRAFRENATIEGLRVLGKRATKAQIETLVDKLMKSHESDNDT